MKKGFTLIELIAVIIIIGVVALISTPIVINIIDKSKEKAYEASIKNIEEAAYKYSIYNNLGYNRLYKELKLDTIQEKGYLQREDIIDPRNDKKMEGCVFYKWLSDENQYDFIYKEDCQIEQVYPKIEIVTNDNNKEWMTELLKFEVQGEFEYYKYCIGENNCKPNLEYKGKLEVSKVGKDIYVCATGYIGEEEGNTICTKGFNIDPNKPEITSNKVTYTSSKIIVNATCSDTLSLVKEIKYSINGGEYQESNLFTNLKTGEYKVKTKCIDNALNESEVEATVELKMSAPTIAQVSQTPSSGTWTQKRVIRITYNSANVESPKYYYSLDGSTWTEVTSTTKDIEFTSNGYLYAKTVDNVGNTASAAAFTVVNVDSTKPSASIAVSNVKTDRATITATCSDNESKISKYEFSKDNGATWVNNGTTASYTFTGLTQGISYTYKVRCTNGSGMTNEASSANATGTITKPTIAQVSQLPTDTDSYPTHASKRVIKVTYTATNIQSPEYYFKSTVSATVASGVVTHACGTSTNPGTCSASSVTTLDANTWYKTSSTTPSITYTQNGYLYAQTWDSADNKATATTFTITNIDTTAPTMSEPSFAIKTDRVTITAKCSDAESGMIDYQFSSNGGETWKFLKSSEESYSYTFTGLKQGTSYDFVVRCINGAALTSIESATKTTSSITKPTIAQVSQLPADTESYPTYASRREIKITYNGSNIQNPEYYLKSSVTADDSSLSITYICGNGTNPGECTRLEDGNPKLTAGYWYKTDNATPIITFTENGNLYAQIWDPADNKATASTFAVTNMDLTDPIMTTPTFAIKTDRVTITAKCSDAESGMVDYQFSSNGGETWKFLKSSEESYSYTFTGLKQGTSYDFAVRCINGAALTTTYTATKTTASITKPTIAQASQSPSSGDYAQKRVIKVTYTGTSIQNPEYYFKSSVSATVASGVVTHACGNGTNPGTCSASSVTTLAAGYWYKTSSTTPSITYTQNGNLYAQIWDPTDNKATASTYTIANIDATVPTISVGISGKVATFTLKDNIGVIGYRVSKGTTSELEYTTITSATSATATWTASSAGTYYAWVKDVAGNVTYKKFTIPTSAFCSYDIGYIWEYDYSGDIKSFTVPCDGTYKLEVYGAQGGLYAGYGGKGGYSYGNASLTKSSILYVIVGGKGTDGSSSTSSASGGYNGGGSGGGYGGSGGGGATHIATVSGLLKTISLKSKVLIVAGGGGGSSNYGSSYSVGGSGGGTTGGTITSNTTENLGTNGSSGTQSAVGTTGNKGGFGYGGNGTGGAQSGSAGGGGGGLYGGNGGISANGNHAGGGGGSGYIGGVTGGSMQNGQRSGNGYARITLVSTN